MSRPVKQKKYRRPDGRKKIIPEAVGATAHQERTSIGEAVLDLSMKSLDHNNDDNGVLYNGSIRKSASGTADLKELSGVTTRATVSESLVIEKVPSSGFEERNNNVEQISSLASVSVITMDVKSNAKDTDDCFPESNFASSWTLGSAPVAELAAL
ncbi:hypothetical protein BUALT_Bualt19G0052200 [Buddleja alternifolia]|uniref:Uncharacterized protein n=1 Tax=Buddleja alternifolia TaxID=168488 RepID=A0AAV6W563_9LAMI|nr:hypothetical protein BUALT_Bualt19G0052200 [Buddleja alternifolia]